MDKNEHVKELFRIVYTDVKHEINLVTSSRD